MGVVHPFRSTADSLVARIAARQHGVVTIGQLHACGLTPEAIKWRVRTGRLFRIYRGVYAVGHPGLSDRGRWKVATLVGGPDAVLSHRSAAELWELLPPRGGDAHITIPSLIRRESRPGLLVHRSRGIARTTSRDGIPVTMPARTLADLARTGTAAEVRRATRQAEIKGLPLDPEHVPLKTRSDLEDDLRAICRRFEIPPPECNEKVGGHTVDFLWRPQRLIVETDGYVYHRGRQHFRDDRDKDVELELLGFRVVRFDDTRIAEDPAGVADAVRALLAYSSVR